MLAKLFLLFVSAGICSSDEEYDRLFDPNIDVDAIMDNDRVLNVYLACFYNEGPCSDRPKLVKDKIHEVFSTACGKCSDKHRQRLMYLLNKFIEKRPADWERILSIYDPNLEYRDNIEKLKQGKGA